MKKQIRALLTAGSLAACATVQADISIPMNAVDDGSATFFCKNFQTIPSGWKFQSFRLR